MPTTVQVEQLCFVSSKKPGQIQNITLILSKLTTALPAALHAFNFTKLQIPIIIHVYRVDFREGGKNI
jgi:hypothetical protein